MVARNKIMKTVTLVATVCLSLAAMAVCASLSNPDAATATNALSGDKARLSYAIGMMFAERWEAQQVDVDPDLVLRGLKDGQSGAPTLMTQQEVHNLINTFEQGLAERQQKMREDLLAKNKAEGEAFLAKNKTQPGVVTLPDGLQYRIITVGKGEIPGDDDIATVDFRGTFVDGTEFDSSARNGRPLELPIGKVFRGWNEALKLMKTGSKWRLFIPSDLAYGQNGLSSRIPPNATLIIEVELLGVHHPNPQPALAPLPPANPPLTSDIIKVPSADEMKKGAKIEIIKSEDVQKLQQSQPKTAQ
jgi:FKBP-type peptidyl-prolyl cis-trans isomerase FklB